jgi:hypothetical protein
MVDGDIPLIAKLQNSVANSRHSVHMIPPSICLSLSKRDGQSRLSMLLLGYK